MTTAEDIMRDYRYRQFRKEQIRKLRLNQDKTMCVPEHIVWESLIEHMEEIRTDVTLDTVQDSLVDISNLCMLCHMSNRGFKGEPVIQTPRKDKP